MSRRVAVEFTEKGEPIINKCTTSRAPRSVGRSVYISDDMKYILKIDDRGYVHRDSEVYQSIAPEDRKYFVPIVAEGYTKEGDRWTIQEYLDLSWDKSQYDCVLVDELAIRYRLSDIHDNNWAIYKGQPVIFDYGFTIGA